MENAYHDETVVCVMPELESKYQAKSPSSDPAIIFHKNAFIDSQFDSKVTPKFSFLNKRMPPSKELFDFLLSEPFNFLNLFGLDIILAEASSDRELKHFSEGKEKNYKSSSISNSMDNSQLLLLTYVHCKLHAVSENNSNTKCFLYIDTF